MLALKMASGGAHFEPLLAQFCSAVNGAARDTPFCAAPLKTCRPAAPLIFGHRAAPGGGREAKGRLAPPPACHLARVLAFAAFGSASAGAGSARSVFEARTENSSARRSTP